MESNLSSAKDRRVARDGGSEGEALPLELAAVWLLFLVVAVEVLVTYSRLPAHELYHVSGTGFGAGAGRVLVLSNYPIALVAIAVLALLFERLSSRYARSAALAGIVLSAAVFWPGVVDQAHLDAKAVNALPAIGVLIGLALTVLQARNGAAWSGRQPGDRVRIVAPLVAFLAAVPWLAADLGFYLDGVPVLGDVFETSKRPAGALLPAVHHGHHHGMDGVLLLSAAALLSRVVPAVRARRLRIVVGMYVALMAAYGIANIANDAWGEQIVKRGWTTWQIPNVVRPNLTLAWGVIVLGAAAIYTAAVWWRRRSLDRRSVTLEPVAHV